MENVYFDLVENCYFVDDSSYIVRTKDPVENYKLGPEATLVTRFLLLKVLPDIVAMILADQFHYEVTFGEEAQAAARTKVGQVIEDLMSKNLLKSGARPSPPRSPITEKQDTVTTTMAMSILPAIGTTIKPK